ncbi:MAG TPA: hypothetical protein DCY40_03430 [Actinobacteria bacterium]|nr:hypothetical protein [Actinomycetota bacterium]
MPEPTPITTLADFRAALARHDWYYAMSDSHRTYTRGEAEERRLREAARSLGVEGMRAFNEAHRKCFDVDSGAFRPWTPPFPEAVEPACGHSACRQHWIDTGNSACVEGDATVAPVHTRDDQCDVDPETDTCRGCGVGHGDPCPDCGGEAFHVEGCPVLAPQPPPLSVLRRAVEGRTV